MSQPAQQEKSLTTTPWHRSPLIVKFRDAEMILTSFFCLLCPVGGVNDDHHAYFLAFRFSVYSILTMRTLKNLKICHEVHSIIPISYNMWWMKRPTTKSIWATAVFSFSGFQKNTGTADFLHFSPSPRSQRLGASKSGSFLHRLPCENLRHWNRNWIVSKFFVL